MNKNNGRIKMFKLHSEFKPTGDQPQAIDYLLGVTGSGKTFTMANIIEKTRKTNISIST